jgi:hypothetical protein
LQGHLLGDITACEDGLQTSPKRLHFDPKIQDFGSIGKSSDEFFDLFLEGYHMALCVNGGQYHLVFFQSFRDLLYAETAQHDIFPLAPWTELELLHTPEIVDLN